MSLSTYTEESIALLEQMIRIPSFSREESRVADLLEMFFRERDLPYTRAGNNLWICSPGFDKSKPVILLNSHIDTVRDSAGWTYDPFGAVREDNRIIGLGSNDAGASLVALLAAFRLLIEKEQPCHYIFSATAEEEISGDGGVASILDKLGPVDLGIVGEPTLMQMAVAEKGLMVLDGEIIGKSGHSARDEGVNAIYEALPVIEWFRDYQFPLASDFLGPVKMTVTGIEAGSQHNVVPDRCRFMVDVRVNEHYRNAELFELIQKQVDCHLKARSFRLNSSSIPVDHPLVMRGEELGMSKFGSPTTSDQARMPFTTIKIGPGDSARSHTPDEFIFTAEIAEGVKIYRDLLDGLHIHSA